MAMTGKKALIGCAIGCGGLIVFTIAVIAAFSIWLNSPGKLLEPQSLLGSDTRGYVEFRMTLDDPGTEGFVRELIGAMQTIPPDATDELPPWLLNWVANKQAKDTEKKILELFPMVAAWTVQPGSADGEDLHLVTVSIERLGHRMMIGDWIVGLIFGRIDEIRVDRYRNEKIYQLPLNDDDEKLTFFLRGADLFFTSDVDTAHTAVDRLLVPAERSGVGNLDGLFERTAGGGPLRGAVSNDRGELLRLWQWLGEVTDTPPETELWKSLRGLTLAGGPQEDGSLTATLRFHGPDAQWAGRNLPGLTMALEQALSTTKLTPELQARPVGDTIEVDLRIPDLAGVMTGWVDRAREIETDSGVRIDL